MNITTTKPSAYIKSLKPEQQADVQLVDKLITKAMPKQKKVMWEGVFWGGSKQKIIGYGKLSYTRPGNKKVEWFMVGLAQQKNYITVFVNAVEDKMYVAEKYKKELGKVKVGKSSISFKTAADLDQKKFVAMLKHAAKCFENMQ